MKRFVEGEDRRQGVLLPEYLDDFVAEENQVRVIEAFVEELDFAAPDNINRRRLQQAAAWSRRRGSAAIGRANGPRPSIGSFRVGTLRISQANSRTIPYAPLGA
jgi:hypothetical protein